MSGDLRAVLDHFKQPLGLIRKGQGVYDQEGVFQQAAPIRSTFQGVLQPMPGKEIQRLPENQRVSGLFTLHAEKELKVGQGPESNADLVECGGEQFEVEAVEDWKVHGCFFKYRVRKCGQ